MLLVRDEREQLVLLSSSCEFTKVFEREEREVRGRKRAAVSVRREDCVYLWNAFREKNERPERGRVTVIRREKEQSLLE